MVHPVDLGHVPVFAGIAGVLFLFAFQGFGRTRRIAIVAAVCLAVGAAVELVQVASGTGDAEARDIGYDALGVAIGLTVAVIGSRFTSRSVVGGFIVVSALIGVAFIPSGGNAPAFEYASDAVEERCIQQTAAERTPDLDPSSTPEPSVRYTFDAGAGNVVRDRAGELDVTIGDVDAVSWSDDSLLFSGSPPDASSTQPASALRAAVAASDQVTVEAWITPAELPQTGPVRVVTVSGGTDFGETNVHLGIEGFAVSFRVSTDCGFFNWTLSEDVLTAGELSHVVGMYRPGEIVIFVDGEAVVTQAVPVGLLDGWDPTYRLHLGDEASGDRTFAGAIDHVAIYDRVLRAEIVADHFQDGAGHRDVDGFSVPDLGCGRAAAPRSSSPPRAHDSTLDSAGGVLRRDPIGALGDVGLELPDGQHGSVTSRTELAPTFRKIHHGHACGHRLAARPS